MVMDVDSFVDGLIKNHDLSQLMDEEIKLYKQIRMLDSEMHTILYDNYNKLIDAALTIRNISNDFDMVEQDLTSLSDNIKQITVKSNLVCDNLSRQHRHDLAHLSSTYSALESLSRILEFPTEMQTLIDAQKYRDVVQYYLNAKSVLDESRIDSIGEQLQAISTDLKKMLYSQVPSTDQLAMSSYFHAINEDVSNASLALLTAQDLLDEFVADQGQLLSQMLRESMEDYDWVCEKDSKSVRPVIKQIVEEIIIVDALVSKYYDEGIKIERNSDFSAMMSSGARKSNWISDNLIKKIFTERIEIFDRVEFNRRSIVTAIVRILLRAFIECVRLSTFSRSGVAQIQRDSQYLQKSLSDLVTDEKVVATLVDEALISADNRQLVTNSSTSH